MGKIKFDAKLMSKDDNLHVFGIGLRSGNRISYKEDNIRVNIYLYPNKVEMTRSTDEYDVKLSFKLEEKELSTYKLRGHDEFLLDVDTKKLFISDNCVKVDYILEGNVFSYELTMEDL